MFIWIHVARWCAVATRALMLLCAMARRMDGGMLSLAWVCLVAVGAWAENGSWNVLKTALDDAVAVLLASAASTSCSPYLRILGTSDRALWVTPFPN